MYKSLELALLNPLLRLSSSGEGLFSGDVESLVREDLALNRSSRLILLFERLSSPTPRLELDSQLLLSLPEELLRLDVEEKLLERELLGLKLLKSLSVEERVEELGEDVLLLLLVVAGVSVAEDTSVDMRR